MYGERMIENNCLCELISVNDLIHINRFAQMEIQNEWASGNDCMGEWMAVNECTHSQPSSPPDSHSKWMCESMDPFTGHVFPPTTVEEIKHMSPEQIGNSSNAEAPLIGQRFEN